MCALATRLARVFILIMCKKKIYVEFILCDGLVIAQNPTHISPAKISSFRVVVDSYYVDMSTHYEPN